MGIAAAVLMAMIQFLAGPGETGELWAWAKRAGLVAGIWLVAGPVCGMFERPAPSPEQPSGQSRASART